MPPPTPASGQAEGEQNANGQHKNHAALRVHPEATCRAVLTVRNEGAFLLDWLAPHRSLDFNCFVVFSNGCQVGNNGMLDRQQELGWLAHVRNEGPNHDRSIQFTALNTAQNYPLVKEPDWFRPPARRAIQKQKHFSDYGQPH